MISGFDIICISTSEWESPWGSRQQLMSRLSKGNRIFFVEYRYSVIHFLLKPSLIAKIIKGSLRKINNSLFVYIPLPNLPFGNYFECINFINQKFLDLQIRQIRNKYSLKNILFWSFSPTTHHLVKNFEKTLLVYHCIDNYTEEKRSFLRRKCIGKLEAQLIKISDIVFTSSKFLYNKIKSIKGETFFIPSGVDINFSVLKVDKTVDLNVEQGPIVGFIGSLDKRINSELLLLMRKSLPYCQIALIGKNLLDKKVNKRFIDSGIILLGWKKYEIIAEYIKYFKVCIIPYRVNEFTKAIFPIKTYEYLLMGKPVVCTKLPELDFIDNQGLIRIAADNNDFIKQVEYYVNNDSLENSVKRTKFASANSWDARIEEISSIIYKKIKQ